MPVKFCIEKMCMWKRARGSPLKSVPIFSSSKTAGFSREIPLSGVQKSYHEKETRYVGYMFPYISGSFTWAGMCWRLAKHVVTHHARLVVSARREGGRGRASLGAEGFLELPTVPSPIVFLSALSWVQHSPFFTCPAGPHIHQIPVR